jgi:hypothetical protein
MQFQGQSHILSVAIERPDIGVAGLHEAFAAAYWRRFGIELAEIPPVLVNLHTAVIGARPEVSLAALAATERAPTLAAAQVGRTARLVQRRLAPDADLRPRQAADGRGLRRAGHPRADSTARPSSSRATRCARTARQPADHGRVR